MEVELGEKRIERFKSSNTEFTKYAMENVRTGLCICFILIFSKRAVFNCVESNFAFALVLHYCAL